MNKREGMTRQEKQHQNYLKKKQDKVWVKEHNRKTRIQKNKARAMNIEVEREKERIRKRKYNYKEYYHKIPVEKRQARSKVSYAIFIGKLSKPNICSICGEKSNRIESHHKDYSKPFEIEWMCSRCHGKLHRRYKEAI